LQRSVPRGRRIDAPLHPPVEAPFQHAPQPQAVARKEVLQAPGIALARPPCEFEFLLVVGHDGLPTLDICARAGEIHSKIWFFRAAFVIPVILRVVFSVRWGFWKD
jgi:hypothetical protein